MLSIDELLSKLGIPFEKLEEEERKTLMGWLENLSKQQISLEDVKTYIRRMADGVERDLCNELKRNWLDRLLRGKNISSLGARLENYLLLLDFLTAPEKAKRSLEQYLKNLKL